MKASDPWVGRMYVEAYRSGSTMDYVSIVVDESQFLDSVVWVLMVDFRDELQWCTRAKSVLDNQGVRVL